MAFRDGFPEDMEFEFNRPAMQRYWRALIIGNFVAVSCFLAVGGACSGYARALEANPHVSTNILIYSSVQFALAGLAAGAVMGVIFVLLLIIPFQWEAKNTRLIVEGPYLRVISGGIFVDDRRIHFREIGDFRTHHGPLLRWYGLKTLSFRLERGDRPGVQPRISITGLIDPDRVRDQLCDLDAARESYKA